MTTPTAQQRLERAQARRFRESLLDDHFDAALCTVSVDYLVRPLDVFADVARVLRPGGLFLVVFSNRMFETKAVRIWRQASEEERVILIEEFFRVTEGLGPARTFVSKGLPRPRDDRYARPWARPCSARTASGPCSVSRCPRTPPASGAARRSGSASTIAARTSSAGGR